jgi:hypothetical protein
MTMPVARLAPVMVLVLAACLVGCSRQTSIADINRDPARFSGQEITIKGQSSNAFGGMGTGIYQVTDGTGSIWVFSDNFGVPGDGTTVSVTGRIEQGISFGGRNYGVMLRETQARN